MKLVESFKIRKIIRLLKSGELIVVPTETVYGIIGNGFDQNVYRHLNKIKRRPEKKAYTLFVKDLNIVRKYACFNDKYEELLEEMVPGPLTFIMEGRGLPEYIYAKDNSIAFRIPDHYIIRTIMQKIDFPLLSTSANISTENTPGNLNDIKRLFKSDIAYYMKGTIKNNEPSTVIDIRDKLVIERRGLYKVSDFLKYYKPIYLKSRLRILFVCYANIVRSPIAEAYFKSNTDYEIRSSGVHANNIDTPTEEAQSVAIENNIDVSNHKSNKLTDEDLNWADIVITMDNIVKSDICDMFNYNSKIWLTSSFSKKLNGELIPDPFGYKKEAYHKMMKELLYHLNELKMYLARNIVRV